MNSKTQAQYIHALKTAQLDWSDYVLFVVTILHNVVGSKIENDLESIQLLYLNNQKTETIAAILKICHQQPLIKKSSSILIFLSQKHLNLKIIH